MVGALQLRVLSKVSRSVEERGKVPEGERGGPSRTSVVGGGAGDLAGTDPPGVFDPRFQELPAARTLPPRTCLWGLNGSASGALRPESGRRVGGPYSCCDGRQRSSVFSFTGVPSQSRRGRASAQPKKRDWREDYGGPAASASKRLLPSSASGLQAGQDLVTQGPPFSLHPVRGPDTNR